MWRCPACGGSDARQTHLISVSDAASNFVRPWVDEPRHNQLVQCISALWGTTEARLVRCDRCGLRSADPFVAGDETFYSLAYGRQSFHRYPASRWEYKLTQALVASTTGTVFEIGAGDGAFQRSVIAAGVAPSRLHVTEFDDQARQALRELGVRVTAADFREVPAENHAVVCGHQVFEHLADLHAAFDAFDRLTAPDGFVAVSVPNGAHIVRTEAAGGQMDMPPNHVSTWCFTSFSAVAHRHGWRVTDYQEEPISRLSAAKNLATSRTFRARMRKTSLPSLAERWSPSPRARYMLMGAVAATKLPTSYLASSVPYGGSIWVSLQRR
ncbi:class I SAM-dependent methyltransferase [Mycobacterium pinniadriaticum]|uniref:class I SAM-dependent methyltransferase n=1 Tax=Mycobacterium pinniadriaticum TaxID=2994102 RepID=UPI003898EA7B